MAERAQPNPVEPLKPHFDLANRLISQYIGSLEVLGATQDRAEAAEDRADRAEETAKIDSMTGLYNGDKLAEDYAGLQRRHGIKAAERERATDIDPSDITEEHSILMMDLDKFKDVNDNIGHPAANRLLRKVGGIMKNNVRSSDLPVRLHGEEFAVLLPRTTAEQAAEVGEDLRREIEATGAVTVSVGSARLDMERSLEDNLVNADTALYVAKNGGRNQVVSFEELGDLSQPQVAVDTVQPRPEA